MPISTCRNAVFYEMLLRLDHTDSFVAFWSTRSTFLSNGTLCLPCRGSCSAYCVGSINIMHQIVCLDGVTEMVAEGEC
jgi:hypothetical protein